LEVSEAQGVRQPEDENRRLKKLVTDQALDLAILKEASPMRNLPELTQRDREVKFLTAKQ
jgi:hypothetical protein